MSYKKPPIGAYDENTYTNMLAELICYEGGIDETVALRNRQEDLHEAILRYANAGFTPLQEWSEEIDSISIAVMYGNDFYLHIIPQFTYSKKHKEHIRIKAGEMLTNELAVIKTIQRN